MGLTSPPPIWTMSANILFFFFDVTPNLVKFYSIFKIVDIFEKPFVLAVERCWFGCFGFRHICKVWALFGITVVLLGLGGGWTLVFDGNYGNVGLTLSSTGCFYWVRSGVTVT